MAGMLGAFYPRVDVGGLLGGSYPDEISQTDIAALLSAIPKDQPSTGFFGETRSPNGSWIRPGTFFDRLLNGSGGQAQPNPTATDPFANVPQATSAPSSVNDSARAMMSSGIRPDQISGIPSAQSQLPPNAKPTAGVAPPQVSAPEAAPQPNFFDRLGSGIGANSNMLMAMGAALASGGGIGGALSGASKGTAVDRSLSNQTNTMQAVYGALVAKNVPPARAMAIAQAAATDPKLAEVLLPQALGLKPPATMEAFLAERAAAGGGKGSVADAMKEYYDFKRNTSEAEKAGTTQGERVANAQMDLPAAVAQAQEQLRLVGELRNHPGRGQIGWHDVLGSAPLVPSTKGYDAQKLLDQIKGGAFLEAFKTLKGGGQITEVEGRKATDAIARMDRATSKEEFNRALSDYEGVIRLGIDRANQQARQPAPFEFKGNTGWQEVQPGVRIRQVR